jgi:fatty acid desaturase
MEDWVSQRGQALLEARTLKALSQRSDARGFLQLGSQLTALLLTGIGIWASWGTLWLPVLFIAHGILINCLYAAQHEMSHWTAFRTRRLNDLFGDIIGFVIIYPFTWDRLLHFTHHRNTQSWEKDPELLMRAPYTLGSYLLYLSGGSYWYGRIRSTLRVAGGWTAPCVYWLSDEQRRRVIAEARWYVAGYAAIALLSLALQSWAAVEYWLAPMLLTKWFHQLQNIGEHTGLTHVPDTLRNTRTLEGPAVMRWLVWNMSYHTAHHSFPGVPFHQLPALHREIERRLGEKVPTAGYLECHLGLLAAFWRGAEPLEPAQGAA